MRERGNAPSVSRVVGGWEQREGDGGRLNPLNASLSGVRVKSRCGRRRRIGHRGQAVEVPTWLTVLTYAASTLLCIYLVAFIVIFGVAMYFLGKGLRWGNEKGFDLLTKVNEYALKGERLVRQGLDVAVKPEIEGTAAASGAAAFLRTLFRGRRRTPRRRRPAV